MAYEFLDGVDLLPQTPGASAPSIAGLRAFVAVAELGHFGQAAAAARVSQPALSQALAALERNLGVALIERTTRRVLVTPDGQRLLPAVRVRPDRRGRRVCRPLCGWSRQDSAPPCCRRLPFALRDPRNWDSRDSDRQLQAAILVWCIAHPVPVRTSGIYWPAT